MSLNSLFDRVRQDTEARMDLVPVLDMMVSLLIFFVIAAALGQQEAVRVQAAKAGSSAPLDSKSLILYVDSVGAARWNGSPATLPEVVMHTQKWVAQNPQGLVVVRADKRGRVEALVHLVDTLKTVGVSQVALGVDPAPASQP